VPVVLVGPEEAAGTAPNVVAVLSPDADGALVARRIGALTRLHAGSRGRLQAQRDELQRALKLNAMMIAVLTHDLRTPMTAVTLSAEIVEKRAVHDTVKKAAGRIKASIARMSGTIGHLLNVSSGRSGAAPIDPRPDDLARIGGEVVAEFLAARPDADVTFDAVGTTAGLFDAVRMSQVFSHLVGLAVEHGGTAAPVRVTVDGAHRAYLRIGVATPAVFPEGAQAGLFAEARSPGAPPTEVGPALAQVEEAVRAHGGTLVGHSDPVTGSMFDVMLPRLDGQAAADAADKAGGASGENAGAPAGPGHV